MSIGDLLDQAQRSVTRAGGVLVVMIVKRRLNRRQLVEVVELLKFATETLEQVLASTEKGE